MRFFTGVLDTHGLGLGNRARRSYEAMPRQRGLHYEWMCFESAAVLTGWDDPYGDPLVVQDGDWIAAGMTRLDNRQEVERWVHRGERAATDLELVLRVVTRYGSDHVAKLLGDFAFVVWNVRTRSGVAACDAFAVQKIFYTERGRFLAFASRAEALATGNEYEPSHLLALIALRDRPTGLTVFKGVRQLPRASLAIIAERRMNIGQYWHAMDFEMESSWLRSEPHAIESCRELLTDSVRSRVTRDGTTWAQLSGGLDSSSIVSLVQWLATRGDIAHGLAGTVTFVDHHGTGSDERAYSDAVAERWRVPNAKIIEPPMWFDDRYAPPLTDQPLGDIHIYPRDRRLLETVRSAAGRVLLTGIGGDQLFTGNMLFFADWLVRGRGREAVREMARRAAIGRVSFWKLAYRNALLPLLPRAAHARLVRAQRAVPPVRWLERAAVRQHGLSGTPASRSAPHYGGPIGGKYHHVVVSVIADLECMNAGGALADSLEVRHPFLYRPLVEFALRLPPALRSRPHAHRWILREAMREILPDKVRERVGKPGTAEVLGWSFAARRGHLAPLVREPILADLGLVDPVQLRVAFDTALNCPRDPGVIYSPLAMTLAVEAWLQIRCGRWPRSDHANDGSCTTVAPQPLVMRTT
jgi:asparagine synthase (glutamine-hydrolysing)